MPIQNATSNLSAISSPAVAPADAVSSDASAPPGPLDGFSGSAAATADHPIPCPMLGALTAMGLLTPDVSGDVDLGQIDRVFQDTLAMSGPERALFQLIAPTSLDIGKMVFNALHRDV